MGDFGIGFAAGSALDRILEKDMTPAARLGVCKHEKVSKPCGFSDVEQNLTLVVAAADVFFEDAGAGDSVRASAGNAPFALEPVAGACLKVGDAILSGLPDGLIDPAVGA